MTIPAKIHFCWIGDRLPWAYVFAILSAADQSELPEIILHHTDFLEDDAALQALKHKPSVYLSHLEPLSYLNHVGEVIGFGTNLSDLYRKLESPVMRSDVLRAAILYVEGGVYLDLDTVTVTSLLPLLNETAFVGSEFIVWPQHSGHSSSPFLLARQLILNGLRKMCRKLPRGWVLFKKIERFYFQSVNNAIMGSEPKSKFISDYIESMLRLRHERQLARYALGPHLLQEVAARHMGSDLTIYEPAVFYPLAPEISEHWFRISSVVKLGKVLSPQTRVVHWYASVRTNRRVAQITPDYIEKNRKRQMYSALAHAASRNLPTVTEPSPGPVSS
jgi:hypothetical protein